MLDHEAEQWLEVEGGYKYHCFISWPHTIDSNITQCAQILRDILQQRLASTFHCPKVFLDQRELKGGDEWEKRLRNDLCKSLTMIAVCAPIYYHPKHHWCGREWAAMAALGARRLASEDHKAIIPVIVRQSSPLPAAVAKAQYIDISRSAIQGRRYYSCTEFREKIEEMVARVKEIALGISERKTTANCTHFRFPTESAFSDYKSEKQGFPLMG